MNTVINDLTNLINNDKDVSVYLKPEYTLRSKEYLTWLKYEPSFWNVNELLKKDIFALTDEEKNILKFRNLEIKLIKIFEEFIKSKNTKHSKLVLDFMNIMPIYRYANLKLTCEEIIECTNKLNDMIYLGNQESDPKVKLNSIKNKLNSNNDVKDSFIKSLIDTRLKTIKLSSLNLVKARKIRNNYLY